MSQQGNVEDKEERQQDAAHVATKDTMGKLDSIAQTASPISPKQELKRRIINAAKRDIATYYERWPERALDERGRDNQDLNVRFVQDILNVVDDYEISKP